MNRFLRLAVLCLCLIMACQSVAFAAADKLDDDSKTVKSIEVKELPSKVEYFTKEEFNLEGGVILVTYEDGSTAELSMTSSQLEVNKPNTSKTGSKNVGIKYRGKKTSFKISVAAKGLTVTFRLGSGAEDIQKNVTKGAAVKAAEAPAWEGHTFQGWYADEACTLLYDFDTAIENDTEIDLAKLQGTSDMKKIKDLKDRPLLLFINEWSIGMTLDRNKDLKLSEFGRNDDI